MLGSVADSPLCTCYNDAAQRGGWPERTCREDQSNHRRGAAVRRRSGSGGRTRRRHRRRQAFLLVPWRSPDYGSCTGPKWRNDAGSHLPGLGHVRLPRLRHHGQPRSGRKSLCPPAVSMVSVSARHDPMAEHADHPERGRVNSVGPETRLLGISGVEWRPRRLR